MELSTQKTNKLVVLWWLLRITYGLYWGIIGIDKFFGYVTESELRVSELTLTLLPFPLETLLQIVGVLELVIALLFLTKWPKLGAYCGCILMGLIVINLVTMGEHYDIALHGIVIGIGMVGFIILTNVLFENA